MKRVALWLAVAVLPCCLVGCGDQKKTVYKASGTITYDDNTPVKNARLNFTPVSGSVADGEALPHADSDDNGKFVVSSYGDGDGAPAGEYKVTLSISSVMKPGKPGEPVMPATKSMAAQWAPDFSTADKTPLKVTITSGDNSNLKLEKVKKSSP